MTGLKHSKSAIRHRRADDASGSFESLLAGELRGPALGQERGRGACRLDFAGAFAALVLDDVGEAVGGHDDGEVMSEAIAQGRYPDAIAGLS